MARILPNGSLSGKLGDKVYVNGKHGPYVRAAMDKEKYKDRPLHPTTQKKSKKFGHCSTLVKHLKKELFALQKLSDTGDWHNDLMRVFMSVSQKDAERSVYYHLSNAALRREFGVQRVPFATKMDRALLGYDTSSVYPSYFDLFHHVSLPKSRFVTDQLAVKALFGYFNINRFLEVEVSDVQQYLLAVGGTPSSLCDGKSRTSQELPPCSNTTHKVHLPFVLVQYVVSVDQPEVTILERTYTALYLLG